eukprot:gene5120-8718_t
MSQSPYTQFSCAEYTDRIKYEYEFLQSQFSINKIEVEKLRAEKRELESTIKKYYETSYFLNIQLHKQSLINERLVGFTKRIINQVTNEEEKKNLNGTLNKIVKVSITDIENRIINDKVAFAPFNSEIFHVEGKRKNVQSSAEERVSKQSKIESSPSLLDTNSKIDTEIHHIIEIEDVEEIEKEELENKIEENKMEENKIEENEMETKKVNETEKSLLFPENEQMITEIPDYVVEIGHRNETIRHKVIPMTSEKKYETEIKFTNESKRPKKATFFHEFPHKKSVSSVSFNKDESRFFTATKGGIHIWNLNKLSYRPITNFNCINEGYIRSCILSHDEKILLTCGETPDITLWDIQTSTPKILKTMKTHAPYHYSAVLQNDSKHCFTSMSDGKIAFWDLNAGKVIYTLSGHTESVSSVKLCDDYRVLSASLDKTVRLWDCRMRKDIEVLEFNSPIFTFDFCQRTAIGAVGMENSYISVFDINNFGTTFNFENHTKGVLSLKFSNDGNWFCSGGKDRNVMIFKAPFGPNISKQLESNSILSVDASPGGNFVGSGSWENKATIYKMEY